ANGVVVVGAGPVVYVLNASNGIVLYHYLTHTKVTFWGPGAISRGEFVLGSNDGRIYAFAEPGCPGGSGISGLTGESVTAPTRSDGAAWATRWMSPPVGSPWKVRSHEPRW
ncbi:MAG: hypothetical protein L3K04_07105, partial [Thermoplasmata archaeon]|nr:hypothetical protein [Thermoplasmata archaeon]